MSKYLVQLIVSGARVLGRAFAQAVKEEYASSQRAASARRSNASTDNSNTYVQNAGMSLEEAKQILNIKDIHDKDTLNKHYEHLFSSNAKENGGTLYLQSKVFRAKERIDEEIQFEQSERRQKSNNRDNHTGT
uniref:Mitochondrial import inner membrane translocase subunit Tim16 n=1 Tax=Trichobilharzia regenti TaxID=157069 RepID=A0AA85KL39_TRIRE|nr:unnamed protein product [Trichobilharzia regenti]